MKRAFVTGATGQDGSYMVELLAAKGYEIYTCNFDLADHDTLLSCLHATKPHEIYNFGAVSSIEAANATEKTVAVNAIAVDIMLNWIWRHSRGTRLLQASSSELLDASNAPQTENTPFVIPKTAYARTKLTAHCSVQYMRSLGLHVSNAIFFNHESPRRRAHFVSSRIIEAALRLQRGFGVPLQLKTIYAQRDWGYAPEYVDAAFRMVQHTNGDDYIIATGKSATVQTFVDLAFSQVGMPLSWDGSVAYYQSRVLVEVDNSVAADPRKFQGDAQKACKALQWHAQTKLPALVAIMLSAGGVRGSEK